MHLLNAQTKRKRIWIVGDDAAWQSQTVAALQATGNEACAVDETSAVDDLRDGDVVLLHGALPDPLVCAARVWAILPACPVLIAGNLDADSRSAALEAGVSFIVEERPQPEHLEAVLRIAATRRRGGTPTLLRTMCTTMCSLASRVASSSRDGFLHYAADEISALFGAPLVSITLFEQDGSSAPRSVSVTRAHGDARRQARPDDAELARRTAEEGKPTIVFGPSAPGGTTAAMCVPIPSTHPSSTVARGSLFIAKTEPRSLLTRRDLEVALALAALVAEALAVADANEASAQMDHRMRAVGRLSTIGELAAGIAEEVTRPLAALRGRVDEIIGIAGELVPAFAEIEARDPSVTAILDDMPALLCETWEGLMRAEQVTGHMKELTRPTGGRQEVMVGSIVDASLRLLRSKLRVPVECDVDPALSVSASHGEICQVLVNLIANAGDACEERQRTAEASYRPCIRVSASQAAGVARVRVEDNGTGIASEKLGRIFEPLFTTKAESGTGLGLSIVRRIAQIHGGNVLVESTVGSGTAFVLELPVTPATTPANALANAPANTPTADLTSPHFGRAA